MDAPRVLLHFADQDEAAGRLAAELSLPCAAIETRRFPDGETLLRLPVPVPSRALLFCSLGAPDARWPGPVVSCAQAHGGPATTRVLVGLCGRV